MALGYLGWTESEALAADVNAIRVGYQGKLHMIHYIYGHPKMPPPHTAPPPALTPKAFDSMFNEQKNG